MVRFLVLNLIGVVFCSELASARDVADLLLRHPGFIIAEEHTEIENPIVGAPRIRVFDQEKSRWLFQYESLFGTMIVERSWSSWINVRAEYTKEGKALSERYFRKDGSISQLKTYENGELYQDQIFDLKGEVIEEMTNFELKETRPDSNLSRKLKRVYRNGESELQIWNKDGGWCLHRFDSNKKPLSLFEIVSVSSTQKGMYIRQYREFFENGEMKNMISYYDDNSIKYTAVGSENGEVREVVYYYPNGDVKYRDEFNERGKWIHGELWDQKGRLRRIIVKEYYPDSDKVKSMTAYKDSPGAPVFSQTYDIKGNVLSTEGKENPLLDDEIDLD